MSFNINKTQLLTILIPVFFLIGLGVGFFIWGPGNTGNDAVVGNPAQPGNPGEVQRFEIEIYEDDPVLGPEDAPITIVEFSDYACPYCRRHNVEVFGQIMTTYEGQIRYIYKDLPFQAGPSAAIASMCAQEQGEFWNFHDKLFFVEQPLNKDSYLQYAEDLDLNIEAFTECLEEDRYEDRIMADMDFAKSLGVGSTPTFFINGIYMVGAQPFEAFAQIIDMELKPD